MNITYYVLSESELELLENAEDDFNEILNDKILLFHEYSGLPFWKQSIEFGQGIKAWNPMLELLIRIDKTIDKVLAEPISQIIAQDNNELVFDMTTIDIVWNGLKQLSINDLEEELKNEYLKNSIKNESGYRMDCIDYPDMIIIEFLELFNAFYKAHEQRKRILVKIE